MANLTGNIKDVTNQAPSTVVSITVKAPGVRLGTGSDLIVSSPAEVNFNHDTGALTLTGLTGGLSWLVIEGNGWSDTVALSVADGMTTVVEAVANAAGVPGMVDYVKLMAALSGAVDGVAQDAVDAAADNIKWERGNVLKGADVRSLAAGVWKVYSKITADSLLNVPPQPESRDTAIIEVMVGGRDRKVITWTTFRPATGQPTVYRTHQDTGGAWSEWTQVWPAADNIKWERGNVLKGADVRSLAAGVWKVYSKITADSLLNVPPQPESRDTAIIEVMVGGRDRKVITWTTFRPATGQPTVYRTHQDTGGAWSEWTQVWPIEAPGEQTPTLSRSMWDYHLGMRRTQLSATTGEPLWGWAGVEGAALAIPTHEGSGQACHPSVVHVPGGWNGYEYWMAMTPYPYSAEEHEDPNIIASHDGTTWEVPVGLTNPLDDQSGRPNAHNSDTYLDLGPDGVMRVIWRMVDRPNDNHNYFYMMTSTDGVTWTPKQAIYDTTGTEVAPTITWTGTAWRMYYCRSGVLYYRESASLDTPSWSSFVTCTTELAPGLNRSWWHMDIQYVNGVWWCLMQDRQDGTTLHGDIYLWRSVDGQHWDNSPMPLVQRVGDNYDSVYKSALLVNGEGTAMTFDVFYSTYSHTTREWAIRRTTAAYLN